MGWEILQAAALLVAWIVIIRYVLPRLGVRT